MKKAGITTPPSSSDKNFVKESFMPQEENTTTTEQRKPNRVKLKHALLSTNFFQERAVIEIGEQFDEIAQLFVVKIILLMSGTTGGVISRLAARGCRGTLSKEVADQILDFGIANGLFIKEGEGALSNGPVNRDQEQCAKARIDAQNRKKKGTEREQNATGTRPERELDTDGTRTPVSVSDTVTASVPVSVFVPDSDLPLVVLDEISHSQYLVSHSKEFISRAIEKLEGWILQAKGDPQEFERRAQIGRNGAVGAFQNWVFASVAKEQADAERFKPKSRKKTNHDQNMEILQGVASE